MSDIYPLVVVLDRYNGTYSGGKWTAWNLSYVPSKIDSDDVECADFFSKNMIVYGRGETPQEAIDDLKMILNCGIPDPDEEDEDEEEEKMEPTSVWKIENVDNIWITQDVDGMSLMLKNKDDLTKIMLSGDAIDNFNDKFVISLQADMIEYAKKMRKLEKKNKSLLEVIDKTEEENKNLRIQVRVLEDIKKENYELKAKSKDISDDNASLLETNKKLKQENEKLEKELESIRGYFIAEIKRLRKKYDAVNKLQEKPSTRADILDQAKKCVCGQREQDYGTPESNFQLIADLWNDYLGNNLSKEKRDFEKELGVTHDHKELSVPWEISAMDVSMMMALLKIARIKNGGGSGDSFVDLAGYAACGGEIWEEERKSKDLK